MAGGLFAFFGVLVAYFGIGTFAQVNSIVDITKMTIGLDPVWTGAILTIFVAAITIGGLQSIAAAASRIVPAMAFIYFLSTIGVLLVFADKVPAAVSMIFESAFTTTAATGGFLGATVMMAMRNGVARGYSPMNRASVLPRSWRLPLKRNGRLSRVLFP